MAKHFRDWHIDQDFLLPPSLNDFVPKDHLAYRVRELVREELNLDKILHDYVRERGNPAYHPTMLTCVLLYAFTQGLYSSRKIARACEERLDFKVVSGMNSPNFRTICKFRARHLEALGELFYQVLKLCCEAGLVELGHVALDGTRLKGNAAAGKNRTYEHIKGEEERLKKEVKEWLDKGQKADEAEDKEFGEDKRGDETPDWFNDKEARRKRLKEARERLEAKDKQTREQRKEDEKSGKKKRAATKKIKGPNPKMRYNFTDPDSAMQRTVEGNIQGYNGQAAVDRKAHIIVAHNITNERNDYDQLEVMIEKINENMGRMPDELSCDNGYCSEGNLKLLEERNIRGYVAVGGEPGICKRTLIKGSAIDRMSQRIRKGGKRTRYRLRKSTVEPIFGLIKGARGFRQFLLRGLEKVCSEFSLVCTTHNLLRLLNQRA